MAKEELHTWEEIKFGEVVEAPPTLAFKPKVKSGFTYHKAGGMFSDLSPISHWQKIKSREGRPHHTRPILIRR